MLYLFSSSLHLQFVGGNLPQYVGSWRTIVLLQHLSVIDMRLRQESHESWTPKYRASDFEHHSGLWL